MTMTSTGCELCALSVKHRHNPAAKRGHDRCGGSGIMRDFRGTITTCGCVLNPEPEPGHVNPIFTLEDPATTEAQPGSIVRELHGKRGTGRVVGVRGERLLLDNGTQPRRADVLVVRA